MNRKKLENEVRLLGQGLQVGHSTRVPCPACGASESSFSVTRGYDGLLYNCYRASCPGVGYGPARGFVSTVPVAGEAYNPDKLARDKRVATPYEGELYPLAEHDYAYFAERFELAPFYLPHFTIMRSSLDDTRAQYVLSLQDPRGYTRGHAIRRGGWSGTPATPGRVDSDKPKTRIFMLRPDYFAQHIAYPNERVSRQAVVVEDYISSLKVAQAGHVGVAVMGTNMNAERAMEIRALKPELVTIALDKDATTTALRMMREWGLSWDKTRVLYLDQDIKDMSRDAVKELLQ